MGWQIEKDVCYAGRVVVTGPDGKPRAYHFTPADIAAMHRTGNAKIADRWNIPLVWEHQNEEPSRRPMLQLSQAQRDAEFARGVFGATKGFVVRETPQGPRLRAVLAGDDPADLRQFEKVGFVSPEIQWNWRDTDGKVWNGPTITHIAATPRPVQRHQDSVRMSQTAAVLPRFDAFLQAVAGVPRVGGTMGPLKLRLSLANYAETPMPDPIDDAGGGAGAGTLSPWERIAAALAAAGFQIGDGKNIKDPSHLADLIEVAAMNRGDDDDGDDDDQPPGPEEEGAPEGDLEGPPPGSAPPQGQPVQMSQTVAARAEALERRNFALEIADLERKRKIDPATAAELRETAKTVRLSFGATGEPDVNEVSVRIEAFKKNKPGAAWNPTAKRKKVKLSQTAAGPKSPYADGTPQDEAAAVAAWESGVGRGAQPE